MPDWAIWILIAVALAVGETLSLDFLLGPVALAAALAAIVAALGAPIAVQLVLFILGSVASLAVLRPIARRHLRTPERIKTGVKALIGAPALVIERVDVNGGQVKIGGEIWTARSYDEREVLEPGERAQVIEIQGATALVSQ